MSDVNELLGYTSLLRRFLMFTAPLDGPPTVSFTKEASYAPPPSTSRLLASYRKAAGVTSEQAELAHDTAGFGAAEWGVFIHCLARENVAFVELLEDAERAVCSPTPASIGRWLTEHRWAHQLLVPSKVGRALHNAAKQGEPGWDPVEDPTLFAAGYRCAFGDVLVSTVSEEAADVSGRIFALADRHDGFGIYHASVDVKREPFRASFAYRMWCKRNPDAKFAVLLEAS